MISNLEKFSKFTNIILSIKVLLRIKKINIKKKSLCALNLRRWVKSANQIRVCQIQKSTFQFSENCSQSVNSLWVVCGCAVWDCITFTELENIVFISVLSLVSSFQQTHENKVTYYIPYLAVSTNDSLKTSTAESSRGGVEGGK